jgi:hypothetical protein
VLSICLKIPYLWEQMKFMECLNHAVQIFVFFLSSKIHKIIILLAVLYGCEMWYAH